MVKINFSEEKALVYEYIRGIRPCSITLDPFWKDVFPMELLWYQRKLRVNMILSANMKPCTNKSENVTSDIISSLRVDENGLKIVLVC